MDTTFEDLGLPAPLLQATRDVGYECPSPIQAGAIPPLLAGRDLLGVAQTGTGKTAAFVLPLLAGIDLADARPQILVLAPTRELALQVSEATAVYARHLEDFHILPVYGGQGMGTQLRQLRRGVHMVVGTPGRVRDHLDRGTLVLDGIRSVVLDEADEMLRMGFLEEVTGILDATPEARQTALFSATMPGPVQKIAERYLREPEEVRIESKTTTVDTIRQRYWLVRGATKLDGLVRILEAEETDGVLIFARTKIATTELASKLEARGYAAEPLNGDLTQQARERTVDRLKEGRIDVVVATDVAARGLDVPRISHVVNYDIPYDTESYVHRIGRTGRAGREGQAILFVKHRERRLLKSIERATRQPIEPMDLPTRADVAARRVQLFKEAVKEAYAEDLEPFEELVEEIHAEGEEEPLRLAAALLWLAQKERPLNLGGGAEEPFDPEAYSGPEEERYEVYRVEVGRRQGVLPGNLVGAIVNEAEIAPRFIGRIDLDDTCSYIELPRGLPARTLEHLRGVEVLGVPLGIRRVDPSQRPERRPRKPQGGRPPRPHPGRPRGPRAGPPRGKRPFRKGPRPGPRNKR